MKLSHLIYPTVIPRSIFPLHAAFPSRPTIWTPWTGYRKIKLLNFLPFFDFMWNMDTGSSKKENLALHEGNLCLLISVFTPVLPPLIL